MLQKLADKNIATDRLQEAISSIQEVSYLKYTHLSVDNLVRIQEGMLSPDRGREF